MSSLVSIVLLWVLVYWLYRDYRVDLFRHRMFMLRGELFDLAAENPELFHHPAYWAQRTTLNGFLRFAERIGFLSVILGSRVVALDDASVTAAPIARLDELSQDLPPDLRVQLADIRARMHYEVFKQVLFSSPILTATLIPGAAMLLARAATGRLLFRVAPRLYRAGMNAARGMIVRPLDTLAFGLGGGTTEQPFAGAHSAHALVG